MNSEGDKVYDKIGVEYSKKIENNGINACYERPAMFKLIGNVRGLKVLDVGCGNGIYSEYLLRNGASRVVGIDNSKTMLKLFDARVGFHENVEFHYADISNGLGVLGRDSFDLIVCPLVLHYVSDWLFVFKQFAQRLRLGGRLIFSTAHPFEDFKSSVSGDYFCTEILEEYWPSYGVNVEVYRRPLGAIFDVMNATGFRLLEFVEPRPGGRLEGADPELYDVLSKKPFFICICAEKV